MSEVSFDVSAESREQLGKADVRRLRRQGGVPGIIYGGKSAPKNITMRQNEMIRHLQDESFYSHILSMVVDGTSEQVILKDVQRHPFKQDIMHMDFMRIVAGQKITVTVPLHFVNEDKAPGLDEGGIAQHVIQEVEIEVLPRNLPESIDVDMTGLDIGDSVHLSDLVMPEGVALVALAHGGSDQTVANIMVPRKEVEPEEETDAPEAADVPAANQKDDADEEAGDDK